MGKRLNRIRKVDPDKLRAHVAAGGSFVEAAPIFDCHVNTVIRCAYEYKISILTARRKVTKAQESKLLKHYAKTGRICDAAAHAGVKRYIAKQILIEHGVLRKRCYASPKAKKRAIAAVKNGASAREAAAQVGVSADTVHLWLSQAGFPSAKQIEIDKIVDKLVKLIKKKHCPLSEAARECGISDARAQYLIQVRYGGVRSLMAMLWGNNRSGGARDAKNKKK